MKVIMALCLVVALAASPAMAVCGSCDAGAKPATTTGKTTTSKQIQGTDDMPGPSAEDSLDDVQGVGTGDKLSQQGPVGYDLNTGMANVVPSDSEGDLED
jgi:hypothetical protein